jgi:hypothetical protein
MTQVRNRVRGSGVQGLDIGVGCGVGIGYGFGFGAFLTPDATAAIIRRLEAAKRTLFCSRLRDSRS